MMPRSENEVRRREAPLKTFSSYFLVLSHDCFATTADDGYNVLRSGYTGVGLDIDALCFLRIRTHKLDVDALTISESGTLGRLAARVGAPGWPAERRQQLVDQLSSRPSLQRQRPGPVAG